MPLTSAPLNFAPTPLMEESISTGKATFGNGAVLWPTGRSIAEELEFAVGVARPHADATGVPRAGVMGASDVGPCVLPRPFRLECLEPPLCSPVVVLVVRVGQAGRNLHMWLPAPSCFLHGKRPP